jgi:hypothetical protein
MLTIIPLSSTPPKEETLKTQLGINISISDFLIKTEDPQIIINSIVNIIKEEKKSDKIIYDKLISLFSFYITSKSYTFNETNIKQIVSNLSKVISTFDNNSNYTLFKLHNDMYHLIPHKQIETKHVLLRFIVDNISNNATHHKDIITIFSDFFNNEHINTRILNDTLQLFADFITNNKAYSLLPINIVLINNFISKGEGALSLNESKVLFYLITSSVYIVKYNLTQVNKKLHGDLKEEHELIEMILNKQIKDVLNYDYTKLGATYGVDSVDEIECLCKQIALRDVFLAFGERSEIAFDEFNSKYNVSIEDVEEILINANDNKIVLGKVDYCKKVVKVWFVNKSVYSKSDCEGILNKINKMKQSIEFVIKAIDAI